MGIFASQSPGFTDDPLLIDSSPVEWARSRETVMRSELADAADYGCCGSHSWYFWGFRLHAIFSPDGTRARAVLPKLDEREGGLFLLDRRRERHAGDTLLGDNGYACRGFAAAVSDRDATFRPPAPQSRARNPAASRADPPTDRVDPLALHRPPHPRAPRRSHPRRHARTDPRPVLLPRRSDYSQPSTRTPKSRVDYCA